MGNDGGSIPKRRELVKEAARKKTATELKETRHEQQSHLWAICPLSHRPLAQPIVSDSGGNLYNKDAILEFLLPATENSFGVSKVDQEEVLKGRVRSLKDVVQIKFEVEEEEGEEEAVSKKQNGEPKKANNERWICPITRRELGPSTKSVYLVPCGHAFSESAVKEVSGDSCLQCSEKFASENVISILPISPAEVERLATRAKSLKEQGLTHSLKKASGSGKKRKKNADEATAAAILETESLTTTKPEGQNLAVPNHPSRPSSTSNTEHSTPQPEHSRATNGRTTGGIKNAATASLTAKVLEDERERKRRRQGGLNDNLKDLFSHGRKDPDGGDIRKDGDFMTRGFSIPAGAKR
ncbi:MAG: hypothetical protein M4579_005304 [Chaenotheca gracillima]|nr:MAG: hypothetical protein M4579_005304 [Chaenotheca gracillima]